MQKQKLHIEKADLSTAPAPYWTYKMSQQCKTFVQTNSFLKNDCGFNYQNAHIVELDHDISTPSNDEFTQIIAAQNPVIVLYNGQAGLAYKEEIIKRELNLFSDVWMIQNDTRIYYKVSTEAPNLEEFFGNRSFYADEDNESMYYIAY